jgi:hypothetical protein
MSPGRKMITADHVHGLHLEKNASYLSAMATDGPSNVGGRGVRVHVSDEAMRLLLAHMAMDPRWSAAFDAVAADREARIAETAGTRTLPERLRSRARLAEAMRSAMAARDLARTPRPSGRPENLYTAGELAAIRAELDAAGTERAADGSFTLSEAGS